LHSYKTSNQMVTSLLVPGWIEARRASKINGRKIRLPVTTLRGQPLLQCTVISLCQTIRF
ncbi:unnamed protein product, partial [Trichobilharzia szidati]